MNLRDGVSLDAFYQEANKEFQGAETRINDIEYNFQTRTNGKTVGTIAISLVGTILWAVASYIATFIICRNMDDAGNEVWLLAALGLFLLLLTFMITDKIAQLVYFGNLSTHRNTIAHLYDRVKKGQNSFDVAGEELKQAANRGWNYSLDSAPSVYSEALRVESTVQGMESLEEGFVGSTITGLFFVAVAVITALGSVWLYPTAIDIVDGITASRISDDTLTVLAVIPLILACVGAILLARWVWSESNCTVNNPLLFIAWLGPVAFLIFTVLATALVMLVIGVAIVAVYLVAIAIIVGIISAVCNA